MYGSPVGSKDLNLPFLADSFALGKDDSDHQQHQHHQQHQNQHQQNQMNSGLLRYRSAPSTLLGDVCEEFLPHRSTSPEAASMFARFMGPPDPRDQQQQQQHHHHHHPPPGGKQQPETDAPQRGGFASPTFQMLFHSPHDHPRQLQSPAASASASPALAIDSHGGGGNSGGLLRQSSSPAGLFSNLQAENGYAAAMSGMGGFRPGGAGEPGPGRLKGQISFSSRQGSSVGLMSHISEMGSDGVGGSSPEENGTRNGRDYIPGYPVASWEDSVLLSDSFAGSKRSRDPSDAQNGDVRNHVSNLTHQFSLPKSSSDLNAVEKYLHFQDAVPCKIRAKRGCATHPRSIAERVRRTRISERMRKLQELVPNMDKQTNTADMLDLAVEHIKDLQKSVKTLTDSRANCTCYSKQK